MTDLLIRLYDLPEFAAEAKIRAAGVTVRRALPQSGISCSTGSDAISAAAGVPNAQ
jgi:hypothetical protein